VSPPIKTTKSRIREFFVLDFEKDEVEQEFKDWLRAEETLVIWDRLKLVSFFSILLAVISFWIFGKLIWDSPYRDLKIEKI
jgi:hypothetical protein